MISPIFLLDSAAVEINVELETGSKGIESCLNSVPALPLTARNLSGILDADPSWCCWKLAMDEVLPLRLICPGSSFIG